MNKNKLGSLLLAGAACAYVGSASCNNAPAVKAGAHPSPLVSAVMDARKANTDPVSPKLARIFSKYGPWIETALDMDYSDNRKKGVQIVLITVPPKKLFESSDPQFRDMKNSFDMDFSSAFFVSTVNAIFIPEADTRLIDHEIGHVLTGSDPNRLGMHLEGYSGPSIDRINELAVNRTRMVRDNGTLSHIISHNEIAFRIYRRLDDLGYEMRYVHLVEDKGVLDRLNHAGNGKAAKELTEELKALRKKIGKRIGEIGDMGSEFTKINDDYTKLNVDSSGDPRGICSGDLVKNNGRLAELEKKIESAVREGMVLESLQEFNAHARKVFGELGDGSREGMKRQDEHKKDRMNAYNITYLGSVAEVFARMFDSLVSVYAGGDCVQKYRLNENELGMFEAMSHNGVPMFANAVSKYRLALRMASDGVDPAQISRDLEYAASYEYRGTRYTWVPLDARIYGPLQRIDRITSADVQEWMRNDDPPKIQSVF